MAKYLIILRGLPGSGKSAFAELFNAPICCADDYLMINGQYKWTLPNVLKAHALCEEKCKTLMEAGEPTIVVSNMNVYSKDMRPYRTMARTYHYKVFSVIMENRHEGTNKHGVTDAMIKDLAQKFEIKLYPGMQPDKHKK